MERSAQQSIQTPRASAEDEKPKTKPTRSCTTSSTANEKCKTRWRAALGTAQTIKINSIVTVTSIITTRSNQVQHGNVQQLNHFKNAKQKLEYAEHPSLSHRETNFNRKNSIPPLSTKGAKTLTHRIQNVTNKLP